MSNDSMSAAPKFTPGPWEEEIIGIYGNENPVDVYEITAGAGRVRVAEYLLEADARLIAAAPELYAALQACQAELIRVTTEVNKSSAYTDMIVSDARAALAKVSA